MWLLALMDTRSTPISWTDTHHLSTRDLEDRQEGRAVGVRSLEAYVSREEFPG